MVSPPFLVKHLYRCDSVVISSFVRTGYPTRRLGWLLGRIGYSIMHHYMNYMRRTAGCTWTNYKTNAQIAKDLKITPILDKFLEYKRSWIQHVNRMPRNRLPRVMKYYSPTGTRNHGRHLKRLLDTWDRNGSKSAPTTWKIYDDDDDDDRFSFLSDNSKQCAVVVIRDASTTIPISGWMKCSYSEVTISFLSPRFQMRTLCFCWFV